MVQLVTSSNTITIWQHPPALRYGRRHQRCDMAAEIAYCGCSGSRSCMCNAFSAFLRLHTVNHSLFTAVAYCRLDCCWSSYRSVVAVACASRQCRGIEYSHPKLEYSHPAGYFHILKYLPPILRQRRIFRSPKGLFKRPADIPGAVLIEEPEVGKVKFSN